MKPKVVIVGSGAKLSIVFLDLPDTEEALTIARTMADHTGRTVTVRDANGEFLAKLKPSSKH
jgi:hypothetical protein